MAFESRLALMIGIWTDLRFVSGIVTAIADGVSGAHFSVDKRCFMDIPVDRMV
jgi:hypothetical protein